MKILKNSTVGFKIGLVGASIIVFLLLFCYGIYLNIKAPIGSDDKIISWYAQFGDAFGVLSSLFTAAGTVGLVATIILQYQTLNAQKQELSETREEVAGQRRELSKQSQLMDAQLKAMNSHAVEATFFRLIDRLKSLVSQFDLSVPDHENSGPLTQEYKTISNYQALEEISKKLININHSIDNLDTKEKEYVGQYSRAIYQILKYIDESNIDDLGKEKLIRLIRHELTLSEFKLLAFNSALVEEGKKLKILIEKFSFFKNISLGLLEKDHIRMFNRSAFSENYEKLLSHAEDEF